MTAREALQRLADSATWLYGEREARIAAGMLMEAKWGFGQREMILSPDAEFKAEDFSTVMAEFAEGRPVQYIIGIAEFCEMPFVVREGVLIPRPESEELVSLIVKENAEGGKILDIGTGSGALAISLKRKIPSAELIALDISTDALAIAKENAERLEADIHFIQGDMLQDLEESVRAFGSFDVIVSNPPYIPQSEALEMRDNVTKYEPHLALFVPDNDPLLCYRAVARSAKNILRSGGKLYFEVHENFAHDVKQMLDEMQFCESRCIRDINEKDRIVCAKKQ